MSAPDALLPRRVYRTVTLYGPQWNAPWLSLEATPGCKVVTPPGHQAQTFVIESFAAAEGPPNRPIPRLIELFLVAMGQRSWGGSRFTQRRELFRAVAGFDMVEPDAELPAEDSDAGQSLIDRRRDLPDRVEPILIGAPDPPSYAELQASAKEGPARLARGERSS